MLGLGLWGRDNGRDRFRVGVRERFGLGIG